MSLSNIAHNRMRSFLTVLGIIIGVTAIIALITIVNGVTGEITDQFAALGAGKISVTARGTMLKPGLTDGDLRAIAAIRNVAGVSPTVSATIVAKSDYAWDDEVALEGRGEVYFRVSADLVSRGRALNRLDMESRTRVCVIDSALAKALFYGRDPLGQSVLVNGHSFAIVGVLSDDAAGDVMSQAMGGSDKKLIMPYTTAMALTGSAYVTSLDVHVRDTQFTDQVVGDLEDALYAAFNYRDDTYTVINMESLLDTMNTMLSMMTTMLAGIASIALLVGGIGIMNMMLVSVTERTAEIGLRKALGAEPGQIQLQFLIESFILSLLGGLIGAALGVALSYAFAAIIGSSFRMSWSAIALGVGFSASVGIIFGWTPARKASNLNPIDALRSA
ncbi:MAG: FtsX-like permease family protein [Clostridiales bacterium]|nr:FtsX-like permease family protein [Clostridiales bacterium]